MVGGRAGRRAAAAASEAEAQQLQQEWNQRETVSAEKLLHSRNHVVGIFIAKLEKALPEVAPLWRAIDQKARAYDRGAVAEFRRWPESLRYYIFASFGALLMEAQNMVDAALGMSASEREDYLRTLALIVFGPAAERFALEVTEELMQGGGAVAVPPFSGPAHVEPPAGRASGPYANSLLTGTDAPGVVLGLVEYTVKAGPNAGQKRPATVSRMNTDDMKADLCVFFSPADQPHENALQLQGVPFSAAGEAGTWFHPALDGSLQMVGRLVPNERGADVAFERAPQDAEPGSLG